MPTRKQMEKYSIAAAIRGNMPPTSPAVGPDEMPPEYWQAVLDDPRADTGSRPPGPSIRTQRLAEIQQHVLRVGYRR